MVDGGSRGRVRLAGHVRRRHRDKEDLDIAEVAPAYYGSDEGIGIGATAEVLAGQCLGQPGGSLHLHEVYAVRANTAGNWAKEGRIPCRRSRADGYCMFLRADLVAFQGEASKPIHRSPSGKA